MSMSATLKRLLAGAAVAGAIVTAMPVTEGAASAAAPLPCTVRSVTKAFAAWGDQSNYFLLSGGTFEESSSNWRFGRAASTVADQEPWNVAGTGHSRALKINAGSTASGPASCVGLGEDAVRFFYRSPGDFTSTLYVDITISSALGSYHTTRWINGGAKGWQVSPKIGLPLLTGLGLNQWITVEFRSVGFADWVVDDVMVDPFVSR
jgi:hypothetical protein